MKNKLIKSTEKNEKKIIACFSGLDPTGGAGIQADIETLAAHHCHCLPLITLNSIQDSQGVYKIQAVESLFLKKQFKQLQADMNIAAVKIGMLANSAQIEFLSKLLGSLNQLPIIIDPIFASALGTNISTKKHIKKLAHSLLPLCTLATPNSKEALQLAQALDSSIKESASLEQIADSILKTGLQNLLITGTHLNENKKTIQHYLFSKHEVFTFSNPRLKGEYHGSGCTLASAISANLSHNMTIKEAIMHALTFTESTLNQAQALGHYQLFPNRI